MRIIAGAFKGRRLTQPKGRLTRPTADFVREAWFSIIAGALADASVLDLFAGSGALGLEALSRGARHATFVESARRPLVALRANIDALRVADRTTVRTGDAVTFAEGLAAGAFDVAFADPPYRTAHAAGLVEVFRARPFAAILGVEHSARTPIAGDDTRTYGDVAITFCYRP